MDFYIYNASHKCTICEQKSRDFIQDFFFNSDFKA